MDNLRELLSNQQTPQTTEELARLLRGRLTQQGIDDLYNRLRQNGRLDQTIELNALAKAIKDSGLDEGGMVTVDGKQSKVWRQIPKWDTELEVNAKAETDDRLIFLASVPKIVYSYLLARIIAESEKDLDIEYVLDREAFLEIINRAPHWVLCDEESASDFAGIRNYLFGDSKPSEDLCSFLLAVQNGEASMPGNMLQLRNKIQADTPSSLAIDALRVANLSTERLGVEVNNYFEELREDGKAGITLPKQSYLEIILKYSSNASTTNLKEMLVGLLGWPELLDRIQLIAPNFQPTISSASLAHYGQDAPNVGSISEMAKLLDAMVRHAFSADNSGKNLQAPVEAMTDTGEGFGFGVADESTHKQLNLPQGTKVIEKTGLFPCVSWVRSLADAGLPFHAVLATVVSFVFPDGTIRTFAFSRIYEVLPPTEYVQDELTGIKTLTAYDSGVGGNYHIYRKAVTGQLKKEFRSQLIKYLNLNL